MKATFVKFERTVDIPWAEDRSYSGEYEVQDCDTVESSATAIVLIRDGVGIAVPAHNVRFILFKAL